MKICDRCTLHMKTCDRYITCTAYTAGAHTFEYKDLWGRKRALCLIFTQPPSVGQKIYQVKLFVCSLHRVE